MNDVQKQKPELQIPINMVGIKDLRYPIKVLDKLNKYQQTTANISMSVELPHSYRGTHMSRFITILENHRGEITYKQARVILKEMLTTFDAKKAHFDVSFDYFIDKKAPVTGLSSCLNIPSSFKAELDSEDNFDFVLGVEIPIQTLCPCSKEISEFGAHNQRAVAQIQARFSDFIWIEELVKIAEEAASAPIYTLLKRPDEKFITELAYQNPRFVEDVVRQIAHSLKSDKRITHFEVQVKSFESIHTHDAFAIIIFQR